jgi:hypothetical protein
MSKLFHYRLRGASLAILALAALGFGLPHVAVAGAAITQPRIAIASPKPNTYAAGHRILIRFSCASASGIASCGATLAGPGMSGRHVASGSKLQPAKTGGYTLRITARDRHRRSTTSTVRFLVERKVSWSGYSWFVRHPGLGGPGPNHWSDSVANVHLSGGDLVLSIVRDKSGRWTSAEVDNQRHLGYGTYRWVVASDLSAADPYQVLGMFTFGGGTEVDMERSQWGNQLSTSGSAAVWQDVRNPDRAFRTFNYSNHPPYVHQLTWSPGKIGFMITDATGAVLLDWTVTAGVPTPYREVPIINYWRFHGVAPSGVTTVRISSFTWTPLPR